MAPEKLWPTTRYVATRYVAASQPEKTNESPETSQPETETERGESAWPRKTSAHLEQSIGSERAAQLNRSSKHDSPDGPPTPTQLGKASGSEGPSPHGKPVRPKREIKLKSPTKLEGPSQLTGPSRREKMTHTGKGEGSPS